MSLSDLTAAISRAEQAGGGFHKSWPVECQQRLRSAFTELLDEWPWLHGYRIRWAKIEFRLGNNDRAYAIYEEGLVYAPFCSSLWASYLRFCILTSPASPDKVAALVDRALPLVGNQFYAHEVWDAILEWHERENAFEETVQVLLTILRGTLHQYSRYYAKLVRLVEAGAPTVWFETAEVKPQTKQEVLKVLEAQYIQQQRRVKIAWSYEKRIHRHWLEPTPISRLELQAWSDAIASADGLDLTQSLYRRSLIAGGQTPDVWLSYVRWLLSREQRDHTELDRVFKAGAPLVDIRLYEALWREFIGDIDAAMTLYASTLNSAKAVVQYSQFLGRHKSPEAAQESLEQALSTGTDDNVLVLTEMVKYNADAFSIYPQTALPTYWSSFMKARPDLADQIWEDAPENSVTTQFLELLERTDVSRYIEVDRMVHRSALDL